MGIEAELASRLKDAMRAKNQKELDVLRMVKAHAQSRQTAPGFNGEVDDAFYREVIVSYVKQQKKALIEFQAAGERGKASAAGAEFEISYLTPFLPKLRSEDEVRDIVRGAIKESGAEDPKLMGKVIGLIMRTHKNEVDASMVKRIVKQELS